MMEKDLLIIRHLYLILLWKLWMLMNQELKNTKMCLRKMKFNLNSLLSEYLFDSMITLEFVFEVVIIMR